MCILVLHEQMKLTVSREAQLLAEHSCILIVPPVMADGSPVAVETDLHQSLAGVIGQSHFTVLTPANVSTLCNERRREGEGGREGGREREGERGRERDEKRGREREGEGGRERKREGKGGEGARARERERGGREGGYKVIRVKSATALRLNCSWLMATIIVMLHFCLA